MPAGRTRAIKPGSAKERTLVERLKTWSDERIALKYGWTSRTSANYRERLAPDTMPKKKTPGSAGTVRGISTNPEGLDLVADKHLDSTPSA